MSLLGYDRYCDEITAQIDQLRQLLQGADLSTEVPTCPDWTLNDLVRHIGGNLRTVETAVRTATLIDRPAAQVPHLNGPAGDNPADLDAWLADGAAKYADAVRATNPDANIRVWTLQGPATFWVRRAVHDIVIHRADAALTGGADFTVDDDLAADAIDELLELMSGMQTGGHPRLQELRGLNRTIGLHSTDSAGELSADWFIDLGSDCFSSRRGRGETDVTLSGPLVDVLRVFYRRLPANSDRVAVLGDAGLLYLWLDLVSLD